MIYLLPILAISGVVALLCYARSQQECKGLCVSVAVTAIALLVTAALVIAGLGALRSSLMFGVFFKKINIPFVSLFKKHRILILKLSNLLIKDCDEKSPVNCGTTCC